MARERKHLKNDSDFGPTYPTSDARLRYQRRGPGHWRLMQVGTGRDLGDVYASERELLADVARFAAELEDWLAAHPLRAAGRAGRGRQGRGGSRLPGTSATDDEAEEEE